jgi:hypothetical protein
MAFDSEIYHLLLYIMRAFVLCSAFSLCGTVDNKHSRFLGVPLRLFLVLWGTKGIAEEAWRAR